MQVDVLRGMDALKAVREDWNAVYAADPEAHSFLTWDWTADWLARWNFIWFVLAVKPSADAPRYVAFLPLQVTTDQNKDGSFRNEIKFANWDLADAGGFICDPAHEEEAIPALAKGLKEMSWSNLLLKHFSASPKRLRRFMKAFPERKFKTIELETKQNAGQTICNIFPYVDLPDDWETFLSTGLSANTRQKAKRLLKRLDESGDFRITHADGETFARDLEQMLAYWEQQWLGGQPKPFARAIVDNYRLMLTSAFRAGHLFMPVLWHGERAISILATLIDRERKALRFYMGGRDESFNSPPPGFLTHAYSIRWAIQNGFKTYDLLQGNEPYKYMLGAKDRYVKTLIVKTANPGIALDPLCLPTVLEGAKKLQKEGRTAPADFVYRQILATDPKFAPALWALGTMRILAKDYTSAELLLKDYVEVAPLSKDGWMELGKVRQHLGDAGGAVLCYRKASELDPSDAEAARLSLAVSPLDTLLNTALGKSKASLPLKIQRN